MIDGARGLLAWCEEVVSYPSTSQGKPLAVSQNEIVCQSNLTPIKYQSSLRGMLYWSFQKQMGDPNSGIIGEVFQAARRGNWKAVRFGLNKPVEIDNQDEDPGESVECSQTHPKIHRELLDLFTESSQDN